MSLPEVVLEIINNMGYKYLKTIDTTSRSIVVLCSKGDNKSVIKVKYRLKDFNYEIETGVFVKELITNKYFSVVFVGLCIYAK